MSQRFTEKELCACVWACKQGDQKVFYSVEKHGNPSLSVQDFKDPMNVKLDNGISPLIYIFYEDGSFKEFFLSCGYMQRHSKWSINSETGDLCFSSDFGNEILKISSFVANDKFEIERSMDE
jgi:hypothetical protein